MMKTSFVLSCAAVGVVAAGSVAGVTTWDDRDAFLVSLGGAGTHEDFETYGVDAVDGARTLLLDGFDVSYDGDSLFGVDDVLDVGIGVGPTSGSQYLIANYGSLAPISVTFSFDGLVSDFGIMMRDLEITGLTYETDSGLSGDAFDVTGNNGVAFFGISAGAQAFTSITFSMVAHTSNNYDGVVFDQVTYVPGPGAMGVLGLGGLFVGRRRR